MDNLKELLALIFGQKMNPIALQSYNNSGPNPSLAGLKTSDLDPNQDLTGVLSPSMFSKMGVPSLIGGSLLQAFPGRIPKAAGAGLDALGLLSMLSK